MIKGTAFFPNLTKPNTKFKAEGVYDVRLILSPEDASALEAKCAAVRQEAVNQRVEEAVKKGKKLNPSKVKLGDLPVKPFLDADENETGDFIANFKMVASGVSKKTGNKWTRKPALFDSKNKPVDSSKVIIWGGSILKVAFEIAPFYTDLVGAGASLRLQAVQILKLVEGGDGDASSYGFEADNADGDAYSFDAAASDGGDDTVANPAGDNDDSDDGAEDF